jgi:hypothetical protein
VMVMMATTTEAMSSRRGVNQEASTDVMKRLSPAGQMKP